MIEVDHISEDIFEMNISVMVSEVNMVGNTRKWWVDTGATCHICSNKKMFSSHQSRNDGEQLFMGNYATSKVKGQGKVVLNMTSKK